MKKPEDLSEMRQHPVWTKKRGYLITSELFLDLIFNSACNCNCPFCISRTTEYARQDISAWEKSLKRVLFEYPVRNIILLGGEATIDPDFWRKVSYLGEAVRQVRSNDIENIILTTNGIRLTDPRFLSGILDSPITSVNLSCMHHCPQINDRIFENHMPSLQEIRDIYAQLKKSGRTMRINTNVWNGNLDTVEEMTAFVDCFAGCADVIKFSPLMETSMFGTTQNVTEFTRKHAMSAEQIRLLFDAFAGAGTDGKTANQVLGFLEYREFMLHGQKVLLKYGQVEDKYDRSKEIPTLKLYPNGVVSNEWDYHDKGL